MRRPRGIYRVRSAASVRPDDASRVMGHEATGVVDAVGSDVRTVCPRATG